MINSFGRYKSTVADKADSQDRYNFPKRMHKKQTSLDRSLKYKQIDNHQNGSIASEIDVPEDQD